MLTLTIVRAIILGAILSLSLTSLAASAGKSSRAANVEVDKALAAAIATIRVVDNHSHDDPASPERGKNWNLDDPLGKPDYPDVVPLQRNNPAWIRAWQALYGYHYSDMRTERLRALLQTKLAMMHKAGDTWPGWVLDKAGVDVAFVNAPHLGAGQQNSRFRWVPFADPMLWPFLGTKSRMAYPGGAVSIAQLMNEANVSASPATLEGYETTVVQPTLERWKQSGVPAVKFLAAYARGLDFAPVDRDTATPLYAKGFSGAVLTPTEGKSLEDHLFNDIAARAGALGLVVHIHTGSGNGPYFDNSRANPCLLEPAIDSEPLRHTNFVLLHGGWPFYLVTQAMMDKPNTFADFSAQTFYLTPYALAQVLRGWLEWHPEKVLFGSDAYSDANTPLSDYEEKEWLMTWKARKALGIALSAMMADGEITRNRAIEIAHMVLHDNAATLYGIR
jgi:uncharacterized protein